MATLPVPRAQMLPEPVTHMLKGLMPDLRNLLPPDISVDQFRASIWLELTGRPQLKDCSVESLREAVVKAATYGMLLGRDAHVLPFRNKRKGGRSEATYVPNYFGILLALERSGKVSKAFSHPVYEGDTFSVDYFAESYSHIPYSVLRHERGNLLFYYGAVRLKDGTVHIEVMTIEDIEAIKRRSPSHDEGPWQSDFDMMARKTVLKRCAKYVRLTPQQEAMLEEDDERELTDIPPERHHQNLVDLFGDERPGASTPTTTAAPDSLWRDTLKAHWSEVPEPLRAQCLEVLEGKREVTESEGLALANAVLDTLAHQETGGGC